MFSIIYQANLKDLFIGLLCIGIGSLSRFSICLGLAGIYVIFVNISTTVPGVNHQVLKTDGQFRFLSPWAVPGDRFKLFDAWSQALSKGFTVKEPFKMSI